MIAEIKKQLVNLPHVKKVWVKDSDYSLVKLHGWEEIDLTETNSQEPVNEPIPEQIQEPAKPKKKK